MSGMLCILRIELDAHCRGGEPIKPWVAEVSGLDPKFGLARRFLDPHNDWSQAHASWAGRVYGRVAHFALRDGNLYEVARPVGRSSKRRMGRGYCAVERGQRVALTAEQALRRVCDMQSGGVLVELPEGEETWIARVTGLGTPERIGFAHNDGDRLYLLRSGVYELAERGERRLIGVRDGERRKLTQREAVEWLAL